MSSSRIQIQLETYDAIVDSIEENKKIIIESQSGYVAPDAVCLLNDVIPDYEQADHEVEDMLRLLQKETGLMIDTMRQIRNDSYEHDLSASEGAKTYESTHNTQQ